MAQDDSIPIGFETPTFQNVQSRFEIGGGGTMQVLSGNYPAESASSVDYFAEIVILEQGYPETILLEEVEQLSLSDASIFGYVLNPTESITFNETSARQPSYNWGGRISVVEIATIEYEEINFQQLIEIENLDVTDSLFKPLTRFNKVDTLRLSEQSAHDGDRAVNDTIPEQISVIELTSIPWSISYQDIVIEYLDTASIDDGTPELNWKIDLLSEIGLDDSSTGDVPFEEGWSDNTADYVGSFIPDASGLFFTAEKGDLRDYKVIVRNGAVVDKVTRIKNFVADFSTNSFKYLIASPATVTETTRFDVYGCPIFEETTITITPSILVTVAELQVLDAIREDVRL